MATFDYYYEEISSTLKKNYGFWPTLVYGG